MLQDMERVGLLEAAPVQDLLHRKLMMILGKYLQSVPEAEREKAKLYIDQVVQKATEHCDAVATGAVRPSTPRAPDAPEQSGIWHGLEAHGDPASGVGRV